MSGHATGGIIPESAPAFASAKLTGADYDDLERCTDLPGRR